MVDEHNTKLRERGTKNSFKKEKNKKRRAEKLRTVVVTTWIQKIQSVLFINHHDHDHDDDDEDEEEEEKKMEERNIEKIDGNWNPGIFPIKPGESWRLTTNDQWVVVPFMDSDVQWILLLADSWETYPVAIAIAICISTGKW